jgi:hypothetical protein
LVSHRRAHRPVRGHHSPEGAHRIAGVRLAVRLRDVGTERDAARIGVLDDRYAGLDEVVHRPPGGVRVGVVVVAHLLAGQLLGVGDAEVRTGSDVQRGALVRVLAVAQDGGPLERLGNPSRKSGGGVVDDVVRRYHGAEPAGHGHVVVSGMPEGGERQALPLRQGEPAGPDRFDDVGVGARIHHDRDRRVVLGAGPHHGRSADVDLLDRLRGSGPGGDGLRERVEVRHQELERRDAEGLERSYVPGVVLVGQQAGVDPRVERLDPPVEHLGELGDLLDTRHREPETFDCGRGAARRDDLDSCTVQCPDERLQPRLVVDADERPADHDSVTHRCAVDWTTRIGHGRHW